MKGRLTVIAQCVLVFAAGQSPDAAKTVDGSTDLAAAVELVVNDLGIGVEGLKQVAVEPAEIASNPFLLLDFLDAIDGGGLALVKPAREMIAPQLDHLGRQIVAQRREMGCRPGGDAASNGSAVDHDDFLSC